MAISVALIGARGYTGIELTKLLLRHPQVTLSGLVSSDLGVGLRGHIRGLREKDHRFFSTSDWERALEGIKVLFLATPAEASLEYAARALERKISVIDLSGAFRLAEGSDEECLESYLSWYKMPHTALPLLRRAIYGLQPWQSQKSEPMGRADKEVSPTNNDGKSGDEKPTLIANPGCYATGVLMLLIPLVRANLLELDSVVIDAKSGATGAGRKAAEQILFSEVAEECRPYKVAGHQHFPEIVQTIKRLAGTRVDPFFTTHLLSVRRGILVSLYARVREGVRSDDIAQAFSQSYQSYPFVRFSSFDEPGGEEAISLRNVVGTNMTRIGFRLRERKLFAFSALDNLVKGASGQAIENFNLLNSLPLETGLLELEALT